MLNSQQRALVLHATFASHVTLASLCVCVQYMDRTFVVQQQRIPVYQLGLELWRDHVIRNRQILARLQVCVELGCRTHTALPCPYRALPHLH